MILASLQTLLLFPVGIALFFLWRAAEPVERWLKWVVAGGFLARAVIGQMLFWISWMRLPILQSLQTGDGYWVFARDADFYFPVAAEAAEKGFRAMVFYDRGAASVSYIQVLASAISILGSVVSAGILLNLFCYLGTIAFLKRWRRAQPRTHTVVTVAIVAISLSPSLVLWSLQPLKDSFFQLLFVAFVALCATWQRTWIAGNAWRTRAATGALLALVLFLLAGIRWYFAGALLAATSLFLLSVAFRSTERKRISLGAATIMIVVLTQSFVLSAGPYIPPPRSMFVVLEQTRRGFDATPAGTMIKAPRSVEPLPPTQFANGEAAKIRALLDEQAAGWNRNDVARIMNTYWRSPLLEIVNGATAIHGWDQVLEQCRRARHSTNSFQITDLQLDSAGGKASLSGRWLTDGQTYAFMMDVRRFPNGEWKIVREVLRLPSPSPRTRLERLLAGAAALVVPHSLGARLGLFDIGGGHGLLWFAEIDTLIFDAALLFALRATFTAGIAWLWRSPLTWLVLLTTLIVAVPLVYSISNFGTLFRLREMLYLGLLLMPIGAAAEMYGRNPSTPKAVPKSS